MKFAIKLIDPVQHSLGDLRRLHRAAAKQPGDFGNRLVVQWILRHLMPWFYRGCLFEPTPQTARFVAFSLLAAPSAFPVLMESEPGSSFLF
jgi:hypothetical protein